MASMQYDVVYAARSPADMKQDDFANMVNEICYGRAMDGWRLVSAAGDYGGPIVEKRWNRAFTTRPPQACPMLPWRGR